MKKKKIKRQIKKIEKKKKQNKEKGIFFQSRFIFDFFSHFYHGMSFI